MNFIDFSTRLFDFFIEDTLDNEKQILHLQDLLNKSQIHFIELLKKVDYAHFSTIKSVRGNGEDRKNRVIEILDSKIQTSAEEISKIINGDLHAHDAKLYHYLFDNPSLTCLTINKGQSFYRMRSSKEKGYEFFNNSSMFVINYANETSLGQSRFNRQGIPTLYVADHLYGCWEETRRPDLLTVNCCRITNVTDLRVLRLYIDNTYTSINSLLLAWLVLVCCYNVKNDVHKFKFEYSVPNLILDMLRYHNKNCKDENKVHGIKYLSSKYQFTDDVQFSNIKSLFMNYVFPTMEELVSKDKGNDLKHMFKITKGYSLTFYQIHNLDFKKYVTWTNSYATSIFHSMEEQLIKEKAEYVY